MVKIKRIHIIAALMILMTPVLLIGLWAAHPTMKVGIVLVDSIDSEYGDIVAEGFDHYDCYFDAEVLPIRFSTIDVTFLDGFYLISDFFRYGEPKELQKEYNVDIILYITGHQINNWDEGGGGFWGEADPETRSSVMTVIVFNSMSERDNRILHHIALHETFHLLGYTHNQQDRTGIMQYDTNIEVLDLVPFYQVQLPSRTVGFFLFPYAEFGFARLLYQGIFSLALLPMFTGVSICTISLYSRFVRDKKSLKGLVLAYPVVLFLLMEMADSFISFTIFSAMVISLPALFDIYCALIEQIKGRNEDKGDPLNDNII